MTTLITGGSKCGKSSFAEKLLNDFTGRKIYIATMQPFGADAFEAIERHRKMRAGKGFETLALLEECKSLPWAAVYDELCLRNNVPVGQDFITEVEKYERDVTSKR